jgi:hypothetical protein
MSETQVQVETSKIEPHELTQEQIKNLIELAQKENRVESRFILLIEEWIRQGTSFDDTSKFEVIYGEADLVKLEEWNEGYPYRKGTKYLVIPKTVPVIILWYHRWDYGEDRGEREIVYVFTAEGWKKISVR